MKRLNWATTVVIIVGLLLAACAPAAPASTATSAPAAKPAATSVPAAPAPTAAAAPAAQPTSQPPAAATTWRMQNAAVPAHWMVQQVYTPFINEVKEKTGGRLNIQMFPSSGLGYTTTDMLKSLQAGSPEIGEIITSHVAGSWPDVSVMDVPVLFSNAAEVYKGYMASKEAWDKEAQAKWNIKIFMIAVFDEQVVFSKKPLSKLADLKGQKIRIFYADLANMVGALGASPVNIPYADMYSAAERGVIDGISTGLGTAVSMHFWDVTKNFVTDAGIAGFATSLLGVPLPVWNKLPADVQKTLLELGDKYGKLSAEKAEEQKTASAKALVEKGMTWTKVSPEEIRSTRELAMKEVWPKWEQKAGPFGKSMLDTMRKAVSQ